jgi:LEA14-like dessication related protein
MRGRTLAVLTAALLAACASAPVSPPTLQMTGLRLNRMSLAGAELDVKFRIRNPNERDIRVERLEYELYVNQQRLGKGFQPWSVKLGRYEEAEVTSRFDLSLLSVPFAVKSILDRDEVDAHVEGAFFVKGQKPMPFASDARVNLRRGEPKP